jgi:DNA modification methylase
MAEAADESIDLVATSPPYPMIEMWDEVFSALNPVVRSRLEAHDPTGAFTLMHEILDTVWQEVRRVLKPGGLACINIGDATRTIAGDFGLYVNHARIATFMGQLGFTALPAIIWRKQTNAPNKFMGSGMMPPGAYVTLEHEYVLIFRKGSKRSFAAGAEKQLRRESAYFWEERNLWFSDVWMDLKGAGQNLKGRNVRARSGAFPLELPYRLISMFSVKGDLVLDPFLGTGTTMAAAMALGRSSLGYEMGPGLRPAILESFENLVEAANSRLAARLAAHESFVEKQLSAGYGFKHFNRNYGFPVMTRQETDLFLNPVRSINKGSTGGWVVELADEGQAASLGPEAGLDGNVAEKQSRLFD